MDVTEVPIHEIPMPRVHGPAADLGVDDLRSQARHLWNSEPSCDPSARTSLLTRLAHLEYELERLHYRTLEGRPADRAELAGLAAELSKLQARWHRATAAA